MSIAISNFDKVKIEGGLNNTSLYNAYMRCVENDRSLLPSAGRIPTIWSLEKATDGTGYAKGDAVWLNTEDVREFVQTNEDAITMYVEKRLPGRVGSLSAVYSDLLNFFVDVVEGNGGIESPYFLGDLTKPVQIRISDIDGNTAKPDDDSCWHDFWERGNDEKNRQTINTECSSITDTQLGSHMVGYHLVGTEDGLQNYLKKDISNLQGIQQFKSHQYFNGTTGFDFVKVSIQRETTDGCHRWFRLWNSGMLEHGGVVDTTKPYGNDSLEYDGQCYRIALDWDSGTLKTPIYDYQNAGLNSFYDVDMYFRFSRDKDMARIDRSNTLFLTYRYNIQVSPIFECDENPFNGNNCMEINTIRNDSFCFQLNPNVGMYSYYASGMTYSNVRKF